MINRARLFAFLITMAPLSAAAQDPLPHRPAEIDTFAKDFAHLRSALLTLQTKIDETSATIARYTSVEFARGQATELKSTLDKLLAAVVDNGPLSAAGERARLCAH